MKNYKDQEVFTRYYNVIGEIINKNIELQREKQKPIKERELLAKTEESNSEEIKNIDEEIKNIENKIHDLKIYQKEEEERKRLALEEKERKEREQKNKEIRSIVIRLSFFLGIYLIGVFIFLEFGADIGVALAWPIILSVIVGILLAIISQ